MSKSYGNVISIFAPEKEVRKSIMRIVTDSKTPEEPKDPGTCNLFQIYKFFAPKPRLEEVRQAYLNGGQAYGTLKAELADLVLAYFADARIKFSGLINDRTYVDGLLKVGGEKARGLAIPIIERVRKAVGTAY